MIDYSSLLPDSCFTWRILTLGLANSIIGVSFLASTSVNSQIIPDRTLGNEGSILSLEQTINGIPSHLIEGGTRRGGNLFHSFQQFNINEGKGAYFANPEGVVNIFSRVTGANTSQIMGKLGVLGNANLFFLNPHGIVFGANSSLNIRGSFIASTADSIIFDNGFGFSATHPQEVPLLTINTPIGLQTGANPQAIINRSQAENSEGKKIGLRIEPQQKIIFIGGNINLEGGIISAEGGQIELASIGENSRINYGSTLDYSTALTFGDINLTQGSILDVDGEQQGEIRIQGRNLLLTDGSLIDADNSTASPGKPINITTSESVELVGSGASAGDSQISIAPFAQGNGGNLTITTQRLTLRDGAYIIGNVAQNATGKAGVITINATELVELKGQVADGSFPSDIELGTGSNSPSGRAGTIIINTKFLQVQDGGFITTSSFRSSPADGGNINIFASESVELSGVFRGGNGAAGLFAQVNPGTRGNAGQIRVETKRLNVTNGGQISISTQSVGNAGQMIINATESIEVKGGGLREDGSRFNSGLFSSVGRRDITNSSGQGGNIILNTGKLVVDQAPITAQTFGSGDGGSILINAQEISILNGGVISANTFGKGQGGSVNLNVQDSLSLSGSGQLFTPPGITDIPITKSAIFVASEGSGNAGNIKIKASNIQLDTATTISASTIDAQGGNVDLNTRNSLILRNGSSITAASEGIGNAGNLNLQGGQIELYDGSTLQTTTTSGEGGDISINLADLLLLRRGAGITSTAGTAQTGGNGGNILIVTPFLIAQPSENSDITANAFTGQGGNIDITAQGVLGMRVLSRSQLESLLETNDPEQLDPALVPTSDITAISQSNPSLNGQVILRSPDTDANLTTVTLPSEIVDSTQLIARGCSAGGVRAKVQGSLIVTGRGGLPTNPTGLISGETLLLTWEESLSDPGDRATVPRADLTPVLVEVQALVKRPDGRVILAANPGENQGRAFWNPSFSCQDLP